MPAIELLEKYKKAWKEFQNKMADLRKRQSVVLANITKKLDHQKIEKLREKIKNK